MGKYKNHEDHAIQPRAASAIARRNNATIRILETIGIQIPHADVRSWTSWHHHMSLVALAHLFVTQTWRDLNRVF
jgi:hypothetical protein